ncbi:Methyltransferase domain-containing protein [Kaistia soli DSM 19436]|uniref:Methyltransferase domain-containing protein n=1 Tax=Kaistia soli DSM 19436 TaxID=1122133 RepID=A0A1M4W081_9HYPH|nr:class I SAM-dependent methyltransferase [Kaistia soli]SHE74616.1 Methyltransferase domain-containing protein [Kaistia soli DSM 19436]
MGRLTDLFRRERPASPPPPPTDAASAKVIAFYDAFTDYDAQANQGWLGPQVSFGLVYPHLAPSQHIVDFGVGTGLGAALFRKAGCTIIGLDASAGLLAACGAKGICEALHLHDLNQAPYPIESASADHIVCNGVLHFIPDLGVVLDEANRILRPGGAFYFDVARILSPPNPEAREGIATGSGQRMILHPDAAIQELLAARGLKVSASLPYFFFDEMFEIDGIVTLTRLHFQAYLCHKPA